MDSSTPLPSFDSQGFRFDSTDFAMTFASTNFVQPCEIMRYEWEEIGKSVNDDEKPSNDNTSHKDSF